jgi:hypothetical protein
MTGVKVIISENGGKERVFEAISSNNPAEEGEMLVPISRGGQVQFLAREITPRKKVTTLLTRLKQRLPRHT